MRKTRRQLHMERQAKVEEERIQKKRQVLMSRTLFGGPRPKTVAIAAKQKPYRSDLHQKQYPSLGVMERGVVGPHRAEYSEEMLEREKIAQVEIARKRNRVAPLYSKGAYQYITDDTDPKEIGRKL